MIHHIVQAIAFAIASYAVISIFIGLVATPINIFRKKMLDPEAMRDFSRSYLDAGAREGHLQSAAFGERAVFAPSDQKGEGILAAVGNFESATEAGKIIDFLLTLLIGTFDMAIRWPFDLWNWARR